MKREDGFCYYPSLARVGRLMGGSWIIRAYGTLEILGGLSFIIPDVIRIQPRLVLLAVAGLVLVIIGVIIFHVGWDESQNFVMNIILSAFPVFMAYGRWCIKPIPERSTETAE